MKKTYHIPLGEWPLYIKPYHDLMKRVGLTPDDTDADVLVLPGGADIGMRPKRDSKEFKLLEKFKSKGKPVLGICRGMQIMLNEYPMIEHIPDLKLNEKHTTVSGHWKGESSFHKTHLGLNTNSRHHQGFLKKDIKDWDVIDWTDENIVEAVRKDNLFAVQWHPEHEEMNGTPEQEWWINTVLSIL